jgi:hypothetical protein
VGNLTKLWKFTASEGINTLYWKMVANLDDDKEIIARDLYKMVVEYGGEEQLNILQNITIDNYENCSKREGSRKGILAMPEFLVKMEAELRK